MRLTGLRVGSVAIMDSNHQKADAEIESTNASGELYGRYLDQIYRYVIYQVRDNSTARYLTQAVFLEAWKTSKGDEIDGPQFSAGLYRIAYRLVAQYFRANP